MTAYTDDDVARYLAASDDNWHRHAGHHVVLVSRYSVVSDRVALDTEGRIVILPNDEHPLAASLIDYVDDAEAHTLECLTCGDVLLDADEDVLGLIKEDAA